MFVAVKELKLYDENRKMTVFRPGDEVIGFESWGEVPKRAHLNLEYVKEVKDAPTSPPAKKRTKKLKG